MKVKASTSAPENDDVVEFSLIDEDDDILMQAENELLFNETEPQEDETTADLDGVDFDEDLTEEDVGNISIGVVPDIHNNVDQEHVPGFDTVTGSLWIYPTNISVRDYQYNIVQQALFKNTLVVLPTGLGKTFIAAVVMYNLYRWFPQGKIIFMAPTKPLVTQQMNACYNIMGIPVDDTIEMTGSLPPKEREKAWREKRVVFLTPQVMISDLSRGSCKAQSIKCIVVDEAHKALRNYAYCQVIKEVVKYTRQFRVLALSATPGADLKSVQQVISNLLISHIELRSEESIDIQPYTHERKVEKVIVPMGEELSGIRLQYIQVMNSVIQRMIRNKVLYSREATKFSKFLLLKARDEFRQNPPQNMQQAQFGNVEADFAMAISLYHGFELLQLHGLKSLYNYLMAIISGEKGYGRTRNELLRHPDFNDIMDKLRQKFSNLNTSTSLDVKVAVGHPKMQRLEEIVVEHFKSFEQKSLETRVMIFSQYRDSVQEITSILKQHHPLVKVMPFIGQASVGKSTKGYTQKEQLMVMKQFREGGYNTLVSTCVGEEGLDIGDVDLIICFDAHKSPIRLVQRMGRTGRKRQGRIVMLVTEGTEERIYNQSLYSKKAVHKAILNGAKSLHFYQNNPRLVDPSVKPQCHKMYITVAAHADKEKKQTARARKSTGKMSDFFSKKMKISNENEHMTREEYNAIKEEFAKIPTLAKFIPRPKCICLKSKKQAGPSSRSESDICFGEWMPWQNRLQKTFLVSHSIQSLHLVEDSKFIELQQALGDTEDYYGLEMSRINRGQETRLGQSSIVSFLSTSQSKPENPNTAGCSPVNTIQAILIDSDTEENKNTALSLNQNNTLRPRAVPHRSQESKIKKFFKSTPRNISKGKRLKAKQRSGAKRDPELSVSVGQPKQKPKAKRKLIRALGSKQGVSKFETENSERGENSGLKNKSVETVGVVTHEKIVVIEGSEDVLHGSPDIDRHRPSSLADTFVRTAAHEIHVPSPPDISQVKYLFQTLTSKSDFAEIDLEGLIKDWQKSEKNLCEELLSSFHSDLLPADISAKDNWDIEPAPVESSPKLNRLNFNIEVNETMDLGQQQGSAQGDSPQSPLFKSLSGSKNNAECGIKPAANTRTGKKLRPVNKLKKSEDECNLFARRLEKSLGNSTEAKITSGSSTPLENSDSKQITGHITSSVVADVQAMMDSFFSDSLNSSHALKDAEAGRTNVSSFLTYTQALECLDSSSSEGSLEKSHSAVAAGRNEKLNVACDFLGNNINNLLPRPNLPPGRLHCYLKSPETSPIMNNIARTTSSNFSATNLPDPSSENAFPAPRSVRISGCAVDLNETPRFDLGFDLDDEDDFLLTPSKHLSRIDSSVLNLSEDVNHTDGSGNKQNTHFNAELSKNTSLKFCKDNVLKSYEEAVYMDNNIEESWQALNHPKDNEKLGVFTDSPMSPELTDDSIVLDTPEKSLKASVRSRTLPQTSIFGKSSVSDHESRNDFSVKKNMTNSVASAIMLDIKQETQAPIIDEGKSNLSFSPKVMKLPFAAYASSQQTAKASIIETNSDDKSGKSPANEKASKLKRSKLRLGEKRVRYNELDSALVRNAADVEAKQRRREKKVKISFNLYDFDCDTIGDVNASTPVKLPADLEKVIENVSMNLTPIEKTHKVSHTDAKEESDDSFIIRRRKKPPANLNTSSDKGEKNKVQQEASCSKQTLNLIISSDDEDDFEYEGNLTAEKIRLQKMKKGKAGQRSTKLHQPKLLKNKCHAKAFIEEEADVSGEDNSSDEREDFDDLYEASFIDNNTQMVHSQQTDMQAVYLKSMKSPPLPGRYKLLYDRKIKDHADVYSQQLSEDHGNSNYEEDSFCVGSDDIESSFSEEESSQEKFTRLSKKSKKPKILAGRRIVKMCDSSSDEGDKVVLTQEFSVIDRKNVRKMLSSSEDEVERQPISNLRVTANQNATAATRDDPRSEQKEFQPFLPQLVKSSKASTVSPQVNSDAGSTEPPKAGEAVNFLLLEEADWFDDADLLGQDEIDGGGVSEVKQPNRTTSSHDSINVTSGSTSPVISSSKRSTNLFIKNSTANKGISNNGDFSACIPASDTRSSFINTSDTTGSCFSSSTALIHQHGRKSACGDVPSFDTKTDKLPLTREERLKRQREKQEKFQLKLKQVQQCNAAPRTLLESSLASDGSSTTNMAEANQSSENSVADLNASSSSFTRILPAKSTKELQILVDSREVSVAQNIISALRIKHSINVTAWQISNCDYVLSNHLAADRVLWSAFSNSTNTGKLAARLCEMQALYNRCVLIIETDPVKPGQEKAKKVGHRTKHLDTTLSYLIQTKVKLYFTDSNEETALLLSQLCHIEDKKGRSLDVPTTLTSRQEEMMKFVLHFPGIIVPQALNLVHRFRSLADLIDSSPSLIQERGRMSSSSAQAIHQFLHYKFDLQMLPNPK